MKKILPKVFYLSSKKYLVNVIERSIYPGSKYFNKKKSISEKLKITMNNCRQEIINYKNNPISNNNGNYKIDHIKFPGYNRKLKNIQDLIKIGVLFKNVCEDADKSKKDKKAEYIILINFRKDKTKVLQLIYEKQNDIIIGILKKRLFYFRIKIYLFYYL
jgi:hypothetical protein